MPALLGCSPPRLPRSARQNFIKASKSRVEYRTVARHVAMGGIGGGAGFGRYKGIDVRMARSNGYGGCIHETRNVYLRIMIPIAAIEERRRLSLSTTGE